ncbi:MAG: DUF1810 domain-containing protein [Lachnospiraceae bacterium]|nr:DUF1810 domain-containing protein [Lachnospiraceae bacterium]
MADITRFIKEQQADFETALSEIRSGRKRSHWMWYIFPQLKGLGMTSTADYYGIDGIEEAKEYLSDEYLSNNLLTISKALLDLEETDSGIVLGYPDDLKLRSSMTLFYYAADDEELKTVFKGVIDKFYHGEFDHRTEEMLGI